MASRLVDVFIRLVHRNFPRLIYLAIVLIPVLVILTEVTVRLVLSMSTVGLSLLLNLVSVRQSLGAVGLSLGAIRRVLVASLRGFLMGS